MKINKMILLKAMTRRGWKQSDLARAYGCSRQYIGQIVNNDSDRKAYTIQRLANRLGINAIDLVKGDNSYASS